MRSERCVWLRFEGVDALVLRYLILITPSRRASLVKGDFPPKLVPNGNGPNFITESS